MLKPGKKRVGESIINESSMFGFFIVQLLHPITSRFTTLFVPKVNQEFQKLQVGPGVPS